MFLRTLTKRSTKGYSTKPVGLGTELDRLQAALDSAETIIIGAGAGLSTSAGFTYSGERFEKYFSDFIAKYGFSDMYSGGFYRYPTPEEHWAYWSRYVYINRYMDAPKPVYDNLLALVRDKDYFVLTTNVDHCFQKAGFDKQRLFYTQGDYGLFQCSKPCRQETFENASVIRRMFNEQADMKVPAELVPKCPYCGRSMTMNLRADDYFVEDEGWHHAAMRYEKFLSTHRDGRMLLLELGVGYNTPGIIKYPFWRMALNNPEAIYACINYGEVYCPKEIQDHAICINSDIGTVLADLK